LKSTLSLPWATPKDGCRRAHIAGLSACNSLARVIDQLVAAALGRKDLFSIQAVARGLMLGEGSGVGEEDRRVNVGVHSRGIAFVRNYIVSTVEWRSWFPLGRQKSTGPTAAGKRWQMSCLFMTVGGGFTL
jgi:hypothetical protein